MKELEGLEAVFLDEFKNCGPMIGVFFHRLYGALSQKLAERVMKDFELPLRVEDVSHAISSALCDNHWSFSSLEEKAEKEGITHTEYMAKYFVKNIKGMVEWLEEDQKIARGDLPDD